MDMLSVDEKVAILRAIQRKHKGTLTAEIIVEDSQDLKHPLHYYFNWDDKQCGVLYRLEQARALVRLTKVVITETEISMRVPIFAHDPSVENGYVEIQATPEINQRDILFEELEQIRFRIERAQGVAAAIKESRPSFPSLLQAFDTLLTAVGKIKAQIKKSR
jgi:hypothetical protein